MMNYREEFVTENTQTIKVLVKSVMKKLGIAQNEYDDCLQEAYILIFKAADKYNQQKEFGPFARRVITNGLIDIYKRNRELMKEVLSLDNAINQDEEENGTPFIELLTGENETENQALQNITVKQMQEYITKVKTNCTAATTLKGFQALEMKMAGYSGVQIAKMFHVPSNSLRSWMSMARKRLLNDDHIMELLDA